MHIATQPAKAADPVLEAMTRNADFSLLFRNNFPLEIDKWKCSMHVVTPNTLNLPSSTDPQKSPENPWEIMTDKGNLLTVEV